MIALFPKVNEAWSLYHLQQYLLYVVYNWMSFEDAKWDEIKLIFKFSWVVYKCMQQQQITIFLVTIAQGWWDSYEWEIYLPNISVRQNQLSSGASKG